MQLPHRVATVLDTKSAYQYEINAANDQPLQRPYTYKTTMAGTTLDLQTGTTKHTYNLAGYGGSIPHSLRHEVLRQHAEGAVPHPPVSAPPRAPMAASCSVCLVGASQHKQGLLSCVCVLVVVVMGLSCPRPSHSLSLALHSGRTCC